MDIALKDGEVLEELFGDKKIIQNVSLYRFTSDSVLLSKFVKGKKGDAVADFCAGSGIVGLHFLCLNPHVKGVTLFEMQPALSDMSARTIACNGEQVTSFIKAFCDKIELAGFTASYYADKTMAYETFNLEELSAYPLWYAEYQPVPSLYYHFDLWQYTHTGAVPGIEGSVDLNLAFRDFPISS